MLTIVSLIILALSGLLVMGAVRYINLDPWEPANKYEIRRILRANKLWDRFQKKELQCIICGEIVTFQTLGAIYENKEKKHGNLVILCKNPRCLKEYLWNKEQKEIAEIIQ